MNSPLLKSERADKPSRARQLPLTTLTTLATRLILLGLAWWIISEGQPAALVAGVPAVLAATALSLALAPPARHMLHPLGLMLFAGFFVRRSMLAGLDVAWRILQRVPACDPVLCRVPLYLPAGGPRWLLADCMSLLPGTLSVALEDEVLVLHRLGGDCPGAEDVRDVERRIAHMLHLQLEQPR